MGLINWGNLGQQGNSSSGIPSGVIDWGGLAARASAGAKAIQIGKQQEQDQLQQSIQQLKQKQQSKGINNPGSLVTLQAQLQNRQITPQQFSQQFQQASKGATGVNNTNQSTAPKTTLKDVIGNSVAAGKNLVSTGSTNTPSPPTFNTSNPTGATGIQRLKNDVVSAYQHINPFSGVHDANKLISQTQQQYGLTPDFIKILHNANTSLTNKQLMSGTADAVTNIPGKNPNVVNRTQIASSKVAPLPGNVKGKAQDTVVHEGLHQVWEANPKMRSQFAQDYNQSTNPALQKYLQQALNVSPSVNLSNFDKLPPALQDEVHSAAVHFYTTINPQNKSSDALTKYYSQFVNIGQAQKSNTQVNLPKGVNKANLQEYGDSSGKTWLEDAKGNRYPIGTQVSLNPSGGFLSNPIVKADKAIISPVTALLNKNPGQAVHNVAQLSRDVTGGTLNQFARGVAAVPPALIREAQNKPVTDIQQKAFGTTDPGDIAKKIIGSTVGTGSLLVGGGEAKGVATGAKPVVKSLLTNMAAGAAGNTGTTLTNNPKATAKNLLTSAGGGAVAGVALTGAAKVANEAGSAVKATIGKDQAVNDLIKNTKTNALQKSEQNTNNVTPLPSSVESPEKTATPVKINDTVPQQGGEVVQKANTNTDIGAVGKNVNKPTEITTPNTTETAKAPAPESTYKVPQELQPLAEKVQSTPYESLTPSSAETKALNDNGTNLKDFYDQVKASPTKLNESGSVDPGQVVSDVKSLVNKYEQPTQYSKDIQEAGHQLEGTKSQITSDTLKATKGMPSLNNDEKRFIQNYRDAKEAGITTPELPAHLQDVNDQITQLNKASFKALDERDVLEGRTPTTHPNPETYIHREIQGKGTPLEQIARGSKQSVSPGAGLGKRTAGEKGRVYQAITDDKGNRQVVAVKNESFGKVKHVYQFGNNQEMSKLGKFDYHPEDRTITNKKGTYKLGQATVNEIEKATGKKYYVDPLLTSVKNYSESRTAAENFKFIESIKNHPDFAKFASEPGTSAPKNWQKVPGLLQFAGWRFEPKTAEALRDITKSSLDEPRMADAVAKVMRQSIVYFPLKHDLNMGAAYAVDRGLSSLANPMAYKRGATSLVKAFQEVTNQGPIFQELQRKGFSLVSSDADKQKLNNYFSSELKNVLGNKRTIAETAKLWGSTPSRIYKSVQQLAVWEVQDILNVARVIERMQPKLIGKGATLEDAMKQTQKFNFQYRVPSRVGGKLLPGKLGRSASRSLHSPALFFGPYAYDKYKILSNIVKDTVNLKTLVKNPKQNAQAVDKLAALGIGAAVAWPLVDKGLQKVTGNPNAHSTAPGPLGPIEAGEAVIKGTKSPESAVTGQISLNPVITEGTQLYGNRNSFTGKNIYDPNASAAQKGKSVLSFLGGQAAPTQKIQQGTKSKGNKALNTFLAVAGTSLPKNSPQSTKLNSLKFDSLSQVQSQAKSQALKKDFKGSQQTIDKYNQQVIQAAKQDLEAAGKPVPSNLNQQLKKGGYLYQPKKATISKWANGKQPVKGTFVP